LWTRPASFLTLKLLARIYNFSNRRRYIGSMSTWEKEDDEEAPHGELQ
jgi:hypothetical protein